MSDRLDAQPVSRQLWLCVQDRLEAGAAWEDIAEELGCTAREIVDWVLNYRAERAKQYVSAGRRGVAYAMADIHDRDVTLAQNAQRFATWRKQNTGVVAQRRANRARASA